MKVVLLFMAAGVAFSQAIVLDPTAEFDLNATLRSRHAGHGARSYVAAYPTGLTFATISESGVSLTAADPDGRILHTAQITSPNARIYQALPRPDGAMWFLSTDPHDLAEGFGAASDLGTALPNPPATGRVNNYQRTYNLIELYDRFGERLELIRTLGLVAGSAIPVAATGTQLVLRSTGPLLFESSAKQVFSFGIPAHGKIEERTRVVLSTPVSRAVPIATGDGKLLLISRDSGNMLVIDPASRSGALVRLTEPHPVRAAVADSGFVFLLSTNAVLQADLAGHIVSTYQLRLRRGFEPFSIGVSGNLLYLVDNAGRAERFQLN